MAANNRTQLKDLFEACDLKGSGLIGPDEFRDLCHRIGISNEDSAVIFMDLDHDGDGEIDFDDFCHGFRDFLTPGSRRGSLQVCLGDGSNVKQLIEMEKKHASARNAWKQFTNNVGTSNVTSFLHSSQDHLEHIDEDIRNEKTNSPVSSQLEKTLTSLMSDVQNLHEEYKSLETSFRKEREAHVAQLSALSAELDMQLAKTEAKVKDEARQEAQKQMDFERKKIAVEMETQMADLSSQMRTFQKVEEWLAEEETREKKIKTHEDYSRLHEAESENRKLRSALVEAQMKATLLNTQLAEKRNEYLDLYHELHSEKVASTEYKNQCDLMQNHLSILSEANRVLSDANDCFSNISLSPGASPLCTLHDEFHGQLMSVSRTSSLDRSGQLKLKMPPSEQQSEADSGRETLLEELRSQGDGSPLPSGVWNSSSNSSPNVDQSQSPTPSNSVMVATTTSKSPDGSSDDTDCDMPLNPSSLDLLDHHQNAAKKFRADIPDPPLVNSVPQRTFKVILAGDAAVGKTTFIERVCNGYFVSNLSSTIGVDFRVKTIELDGKIVCLQLWDTAGQERFRSLTKSYFRRADGVILMYDVTNERTFVSIRHWIQNVEEGAGRKLPIVLCGNKIDVRDELYKGTSCVSTEDGAKLGRQCGALFKETSPKTGHNVTNALCMLAKEMSLMEDAELKNSLKLETVEEAEKSKKRSCCSSGTTTNNNSSSSTNSITNVKSTSNNNNNTLNSQQNSSAHAKLNSSYRSFSSNDNYTPTYVTY